MGKLEYFPAFFGYRRSFAMLTDEQFGRVIRAALAYAEDGEVPDLADLETLAFAVIRGDIDRARKAYDEKCERLRANGMKGGRPASEKPDGTKRFSENQMQPEEPKQNKTIQNKTIQNNTNESISASDDAKPSRARAKKAFSPPTVDEVKAYCEEQGFGTINPAAFVDYYSANGWRVGNHPMKDWRATVRNWARRDKEKGIVPKSLGSFDTDEFLDAAVKASYARIEQTKDEPQESASVEELPEPVVMPSGKRDYSGLWSKIM